MLSPVPCLLPAPPSPHLQEHYKGVHSSVEEGIVKARCATVVTTPWEASL